MTAFRVFISLLFVYGITLACGGDSKTNHSNDPYSLTFDSVMMIHDRTMPQMSTIENLREKLKDQKIAATGSIAGPTRINQLIAELNKAEDAMFDWMNDFKPDNVEETYKLGYMQMELSKIKHMEFLMVTSIEQARSYLEGSGNQ